MAKVLESGRCGRRTDFGGDDLGADSQTMPSNYISGMVAQEQAIIATDMMRVRWGVQ